MSIIQDGTGKGPSAKVTVKNRLAVDAIAVFAEEEAAHDENAFIVHSPCHLSASTAGALLSIKNTSNDYNYHITRIYIDPHKITPTALRVTQVLDPTASVGSSSTISVVNKNTNSAAALTGTFLGSNATADLTLTSGDTYHEFGVKTMSSMERDMKGTNIIGPNKTIAWGFNSTTAATNAEVIGLSINLYREKLDVHS